MSAMDNADRFEAWLRQRNVPAFSRAAVEGLFALASGDPVAPEHIRHSIELARAAGVPSSYADSLRRLGEQVMLFEAEISGGAARGASSTGTPSAAGARPLRTATARPVIPRDEDDGPPSPPGRDQLMDDVRLSGPSPSEMPPARARPSIPRDDDAEWLPPQLGPAAGRSVPPVRAEVTPSDPPPRPASSKPPSVPPPLPAPTAAPSVAPPPPETAAPSSSEPDAPPAAPAAPSARPRRGILGAAAIALTSAAIAAAATTLVLRSSNPASHAETIPARADAAPAPAPVEAAAPRPALLLQGLNLGVTFPPGWREHIPSLAEPNPPGFPEGTGFVYRGDASAEPEHGLFIGVRPLGGPIPTPPAAADAAAEDLLVTLARIAEQGAAARFATDGGPSRYASEGCKVALVGGKNVGYCSGSTASEGPSNKLRTYLLLGQTRAVVAVSLTRSTESDVGDEAEGIVAQLTP